MDALALKSLQVGAWVVSSCGLGHPNLSWNISNKELNGNFQRCLSVVSPLQPTDDTWLSGHLRYHPLRTSYLKPRNGKVLLISCWVSSWLHVVKISTAWWRGCFNSNFNWTSKCELQLLATNRLFMDMRIRLVFVCSPFSHYHHYSVNHRVTALMILGVTSSHRCRCSFPEVGLREENKHIKSSEGTPCYSHLLSKCTTPTLLTSRQCVGDHMWMSLQDDFCWSKTAGVNGVLSDSWLHCRRPPACFSRVDGDYDEDTLSSTVK